MTTINLKRYSTIDLALYGNLACVLLGNYFGAFALLALTFNFCLLVVMGRIIRPTPNLILLGIMLPVWLGGFLVVADELTYAQMASVFSALSAFVCSVLLASSFVANDAHGCMLSLNRFLKFTGLLIFCDVCFSLFVLKYHIEPGVGFHTTLFQNAQTRFFLLVLMPFLLQDFKRQLIPILLLCIFIAVGQRGGIVSLLVVLSISIFAIYAVEKRRTVSSQFVKSALVIFSAVVIVISVSVFTRVTDFTSMTSLVERSIKWASYGQLFVEHPFGTGPSASYYLMQRGGLTEEQEERLEWLKPIVGEQAYIHRVRILSQRHSLGSEESFHVYFLSAFGVVGIFIYLRIASAMCVDLTRLFKG